MSPSRIKNRISAGQIILYRRVSTKPQAEDEYNNSMSSKTLFLHSRLAIPRLQTLPKSYPVSLILNVVWLRVWGVP